MGKRICWGVKIANVKDLKEKIDLTNEAMTYYENKMLAFSMSEGVPEPDTVFCAAAAAKISELFYNTLDDKSKMVCNALVKLSQFESDKTIRNVKVNRNGEFADEV